MLHHQITQVSLKAYEVLRPEGTKRHRNFSETAWWHWREKYTDYKIANNARLCVMHSQWMIKTTCAGGGPRRAQPHCAGLQVQGTPRKEALNLAKKETLEQRNNGKGKESALLKRQMAWEWARMECAKFPADTVRMHVWLGQGWPSSIKRKTGAWLWILQQQTPDRKYCGKKNLRSREWRMLGVLGGSGFIENFPSPISICLEF